MNLTETQMADVLADLTDDGDVYVFDGTRYSLTLHIEVDDITAMEHINDADCWGRVEWAKVDRDTGYCTRPRHFTGAARKLTINGWHMEGEVWWEPYREGHKVYDDPETIAYMRRLLGDGFRQVGVTLHEIVSDSLGHPHTVVVASDWLCGIDSLDNGYLADVIDGRIAELPEVVLITE